MKRWLATLLVAVLLVGLLPTGSMALTQYATVTGGWLRLRNSASFNASTINSYYTGTQVKILDTSGSWYKVEAPDGKVGYMYGDYVFLGGTIIPDGSGDATVISSNGYGVRMRKGPGTGYRVIRTYAVGTRAVVLESGIYWSKISIGGRTGYMMSQFLNTNGGGGGGTYVGDATIWSANGYGVRLRSGPGTEYSKIGVYSVGTQVKVITKGAVWDYIQVGRRQGYMMNTFLNYNDNYDVSAVTISNLNPVVGNVLAVQTVTPGTATVTYSWLVGGVEMGTSASYTVTTADVGKTIQLKVTGTGSYKGTATSTATNAVVSTGVVSSVTLNSMTPEVGNVLKVATLTPAGATVIYVWKVGGVQKANSATYTVDASDVNKKIELIVTGTGAFTGYASSGLTSAVIAGTAPIITTTALPNASVNTAYSTTLTATGSGTMKWTVSAGTLPAGMTLSAEGVLSGTPTTAGTATFTVQASNGIGTAATKQFTFTIGAAKITLADIGGVAVPVKDAVAVATITESTQYTGAVIWSPAPAAGGKFEVGTVYTATITLTPKTSYSFADVAANFFKVAGATTVSNSAKSGVVTAVFPAAAAAVHVPVVDITGVPTNTKYGEPLSLGGLIVPGDATGKQIAWTVKDPGTTRATISYPDCLLTSAVGTATVTATVVNGGATSGTDYTKDFVIVVTDPASVHVPVTGIKDQPIKATSGTALTLTGTVQPSNATAKTIVWSVGNDGGTGTTINGYTLTAKKAGTVTVTATVANGGPTAGTDYTVNFDIDVTDPASVHVPVTDITGVPTTATANTPLTLAGAVDPGNATKTTIVWGVKDAGTTGASITGNAFNATAAGNAKITATITDGTAVGTDYTKDFDIVVSDAAPAHVPVTAITGGPAAATANTALTLGGTVEPSTATNKTIDWSVSNDGGTGASITGSDFNATAAGTAKITATITDGTAAGANYTQDFEITVTVPVTAPTISAQPSNAAVSAGNTATFSVTAAGDDLTYQWQVSSSGSEWSDISGANAASYTTAATADDNGKQYHCKVSNSAGSVTSDSAMLTVS